MKIMILQLVGATFLMSAYVESDDKTLVMVHTVYRHGARAPINFYPNDPDKDKWPVDLGMLTKVGMNMEYDLGKFLKQRYMVEKKFVNSSYIQKEVYIRSSDAQRCLQSAETQLAGLYPPKGYQVWNKNISWQPVPIHSVLPDEDPLLRSDATRCPRRGVLEKKRLNEPGINQVKIKNKEFLQELSSFVGYPVTYSNFLQFDDTVRCGVAQGFTPPKWYTDRETRIKSLSEYLMLHQYVGVNDELGSILGGPLLDVISSNMEAYKRGTNGLWKWLMFSGHDSSILSLVSALNIPFTVPTFAACMMIELYKDNNGKLYVDLQYRNDTSGNTVPIKLPACQQQCPLEDFLRITKPRRSQQQHCFDHKEEKETSQKYIITITILCGLLLVTMAFCAYSMYGQMKRNRKIGVGQGESSEPLMKA